MIKGKVFQVKAGGVRVDAALLSAFPTSTRAFVREAIESHTVLLSRTVDEVPHVVVKGLKLRGGEFIHVRELAEACDNVVAPNAAMVPSCIFEDEALLAFDKPAGLPVQPLSRKETATLMNGVVARWPQCAPLGDRPLLAGALHRIDADTSGLVLVARTAESFAHLRAQFSAQTVRKIYLALVEGEVTAAATLEHDLMHDPTQSFCRMVDRHTARFDPRGLATFHAVTAYEPLAQTMVENEKRTLLRVTIFTGVTHQIRAQLALAGLHIVNDRLYGAFAVEHQVGHCLHAYAAEFRHPVTEKPQTLKTPLPTWARPLVGEDDVLGG